MRSVSRSRLLLYTVAVWVVLAVAAEVGLRLVGLGPPRAADLAPRYSKFQPDDELIWALKPDWDGFELNNVPVHHNSLGLRGAEPGSPGGNGPFRILFLGDSVTYGHHLPGSQTIPHLLENELRARPGRPLEVINAGVPGYSTFQEAAQLRRLGRKIAPHLVLLGFCLNDVTERYRSLATFGGPRYFMINVDTAAGLSWPRRLWLSSAIRQAVVRMVRAAARSGEAYRLRTLWEEPENPKIVAAWRTVLDEIDQIAAEAEALGVPLAVIIYPHARQVEMASGAEAPQQMLTAHLSSRSIPHLDLLGPLRRSPLRMQQIFFDLTHFSAPGAQQAAQEIAEFIRAEGLVAGPDQ